MKAKLVAMAGGLACVFATAVMPIHADEIYSSFSGSTVGLGVDASGQNLGSLGQFKTVPLKKNGEKYNKEGATLVTKSKSTPIRACEKNGMPVGILFVYDHSYSVSTQSNGDLVFAALDPLKESTICALGPTYQGFEVTVYSNITGGTGEFEGACGWTTTTLTGQNFAPGVDFNYVEGTHVGKIFRSPDC